MLVLKLRRGDSARIGADVVVTVVRADGPDALIVTIDAPPSLRITRRPAVALSKTAEESERQIWSVDEKTMVTIPNPDANTTPSRSSGLGQRSEQDFSRMQKSIRRESAGRASRMMLDKPDEGFEGRP